VKKTFRLLSFNKTQQSGFFFYRGIILRKIIFFSVLLFVVSFVLLLSPKSVFAVCGNYDPIAGACFERGTGNIIGDYSVCEDCRWDVGGQQVCCENLNECVTGGGKTCGSSEDPPEDPPCSSPNSCVTETDCPDGRIVAGYSCPSSPPNLVCCAQEEAEPPPPTLSCAHVCYNQGSCPEGTEPRTGTCPGSRTCCTPMDCYDNPDNVWHTGAHTYFDGCIDFLIGLPLCNAIMCNEVPGGPNDDITCGWPEEACVPHEPEVPSDEVCGTIRQDSNTGEITCRDEEGLKISPWDNCSEYDCDPEDWECRNAIPIGGECCVFIVDCSNYDRWKWELIAKSKVFCVDDDPNVRTDDPSSGKIATAIGCIPVTTNPALARFLLSWGIGMGGGIAFILIVSAGFMMITAAGDPQKFKAGKELLVAAVSGLALLVFSVLLLRFIGHDVLVIPGFS
jgi:hypothetical protein